MQALTVKIEWGSPLSAHTGVVKIEAPPILGEIANMEPQEGDCQYGVPGGGALKWAKTVYSVKSRHEPIYNVIILVHGTFPQLCKHVKRVLMTCN